MLEYEHSELLNYIYPDSTANGPHITTKTKKQQYSNTIDFEGGFTMLKKIILSILCIAILTSTVSLNGFAANISTDTFEEDGPSELFISLYSEVFNRTETYNVFDEDDVCITEGFINCYTEAYANEDFYTIWLAVLENHYALKYGSAQLISTLALGPEVEIEKYLESEWVYKLEPLNYLLNGKTVDFVYRITGSYIVTGSKITSYTYPSLEFYFAQEPGILFPYTIDKTTSVTLNPTATSITMGVRFTIEFYFNAKYQTIGPYTPSVTGNA